MNAVERVLEYTQIGKNNIYTTLILFHFYGVVTEGKR